MTQPAHRNQLATETSPYLLQHAHNPVDWFPWSDQALEKAQREDKPILLSIGYSACHWCHVMERESFEDESIAALMNGSFVNIKVDREERPDLDQIYMSAVQLMTGSGGWPLTVFLTPDGKPFYGGTYFPPDDRYNRPGFKRVLAAISEAYQERRSDVLSNAKTLIEQINAQARQGAAGTADLDSGVLDLAMGGLADRFDSTHGGFGPAPKFPPSMSLDFLLRYHDRTGNSSALSMVDVTLDRMARGGLYDQIGGGFHRYSTDERWLVPHFEKMLYDNALLGRIYLDAFLVTQNPLYKTIVEETLDFVSNELRDADGGFYATLDADSEGVEGKYYVWGHEEFTEVVGPDAEAMARYWDISPGGNFEGQNIPNVREGESEPDGVETARRLLLQRRASRIRPGRDEKILTDWNGLMLRAYADAAGRLGREDYRTTAESNAEFILSVMWDGKRLLHAFKDGRGRFNAYLDDYANLVDGLLSLYFLTFEERWLWQAVELTETMIAEFWDSENQAFFFTGNSHETLVARTKEFFDNATPSGNSVAADVMARLGRLLDRKDFTEKSETICRKLTGYVERFPSGFGRTLAALDFLLGPSQEIALVGDPDAFLDVVRKHYLPRTIVAAGTSQGIAPLRGRERVNGSPTAYLCSNYVCQQPTTEAPVLEQQIQGS